MPFPNPFRKSSPSNASSSSPSSSSSSTISVAPKSDLRRVHLPLASPYTPAQALTQLDLLVGDEDQESGWEVPEECCWLKTLKSHGSSRPSTARKSTDGKADEKKVEKPTTPRMPLAGSRFVEMLDIDVNLSIGKTERGGEEGYYERHRRGSCMFDAVEELLKEKVHMRPPMSPGRRAVSYLGKLGSRGEKKQ